MAAKDKLPVVSAPASRPRLVYGTVVALLVWYFVCSVSAVANKSTTFDEVFHLTGGYCAWKFGDFRMQPENGILPQRWAAIPLLFSDTHFPNLDQPRWRQSNMHVIGEQFFYGVGNDADGMLLRARAMIALFGVALGALVFFWMRSLLGVGPALLSLGLYAFCPTLLANGALVTSDMAAALFMSASMLCIWRVLHWVNWHTLLVGSLVVGGLFLSKFSAFLLVPMALVLVTVQLMSWQPTTVTFGRKRWEVSGRLSRLLIHLATIAVCAIVVWFVIWAFYDFRYDMFAAKKLEPNAAGEIVAVDQPYVSWNKLVTKQPGAIEWSILRMRDARFLPEAYLYGFATTWRYAKERAAFLNGEYRLTGFPQFFPYCLMVKTPLTLFVLLSLAAAWIIRRWLATGTDWPTRREAIVAALYRTAPLWTLFILYWAFAVASHLNIGHRHILPTYPPMIMLAGASWFWLAALPRESKSARRLKPDRKRGDSQVFRQLANRRWPILAGIVLVSAGLFAAESLWRWPNYLAYFYQLVGGPWYANRHLVESSLDWGQDLPSLKHWLDKERLDSSTTEKTYLSYFGSANPYYYGIHTTLMPGYWDRLPARIPKPLEAGSYCISATMLQNLYTEFPGHWSKQYEEIYQKVAANVGDFVSNSPADRNRIIQANGEQAILGLFEQYEHLRLARLTSYLRRREPDLEINYSILIYRLSTSELAQALDGPPIELDESPRGNDQLSENAESK